MIAAGRISHFVVLMLENRTFDHIFGFRKGVNGLGGNEHNLLDPAKPPSATNPTFKVSENQPVSTLPSKGPGHNVPDTNVQLFDRESGPAAGHAASNNGFVKSFTTWLGIDKLQPTPALLQLPMASLSPDKIPAINALADAFVLCDNWHAEVPGPTQPNRLYMHAATSFGKAHNLFNAKPLPSFDGPTIYNHVQDAGGTWGVYYHDVRDIDVLARVSTEAANIHLFEQRFAADIKAKKLPNYSFIVPRMMNAHGALANSQHAPEDVRRADNLIADVYEALVATPEVWHKTALIVTYDEHGGFYDHVAPPSTGVPNPDGKISAPSAADPKAPAFAFDRLGLRVPAIIASPWVAPGVDSTPYQHTSVLATVKKMFGLPSFLTKRDASAATFEGLFAKLHAARTDTPKTLPRAAAQAPALAAVDAAHPANQPLDDNQVAYLQQAFHLTAEADPAGPRLEDMERKSQQEVSAFIAQRYAKRFGAPR
jgi:phospholipase C